MGCWEEGSRPCVRSKQNHESSSFCSGLSLPVASRLFPSLEDQCFSSGDPRLELVRSFGSSGKHAS